MLSIIRNLFILFVLALGCAQAVTPVVYFPATAPGELSFIGNAGSDNVFTVKRWKFTQVENVADPARIRIQAVLDMTSIQTGWQELLVSLKAKKDYFHVKKYATATVRIDGAEDLGDGRYRTAALLTLKGVTKPVELEFTLTPQATGPYRVEATGEIHRREFKFTGNGPKEVVPVAVAADLVVVAD
jgi:polyisoprenoid-binding protein YceI